MTTATANKTLQARVTTTRYIETEFDSAQQIEAIHLKTGLDRYAPQALCEVKGRLEMRKDKAAWALAMSRNPYIMDWTSTGLVVSATMCVSVAEQGLAQLQSDLLAIYQDCVHGRIFEGRGIEPHVLIESLKLADEFDGERNGPLSSL